MERLCAFAALLVNPGNVMVRRSQSSVWKRRDARLRKIQSCQTLTIEVCPAVMQGAETFVFLVGSALQLLSQPAFVEFSIAFHMFTLPIDHDEVPK